MKTVVIRSQPKKLNMRDLFLIADKIKLREGLKKKAVQTRFEESEKNKILLRLMHIASPKRPTWFTDSFPLQLTTKEFLNGDVWSRDIKRCNPKKNAQVSAELAYKNITRFLDKQGFNCSVEISKPTKCKQLKILERKVNLFCHGVKD